MNPNTKSNKRKRRQVLVDPNAASFVMDEEDHRVVCEIMSNPGIQYDWQQMLDRLEFDGEQRVWKLELTWSNITPLPSSIGDLKHLKDLDLYCTRKLVKLPEEIGDLASLETLVLKNSGIESLPPSIGRLANLKELDLWGTKLLNLPEEIGDLVSLNKLNLRASNITSLPPSIGRLRNLEYLNLHDTQNLVDLPEEIGDLISLNDLSLRHSNIASLPPSIGRLTNLTYLNLNDALSRGPVARKLYFGMARAIGRSRIGSGSGATGTTNANANINASTNTNTNNNTNTNDSVSALLLSSNLWPLVLHNATRAFQPFRYCCELDLKKTEAIYQLLVDGRESFLGVLVNRRQNSASSSPSSLPTPSAARNEFSNSRQSPCAVFHSLTTLCSHKYLLSNKELTL